MTWLVTGGAGYIGSHVVRALAAVGLDPVVFDDLSSGHADFVPADVPFVRGSVLDGSQLLQSFDEHDITGVVHLAGYKYAGESVHRPLHAYDQNVTGTARLLAVMDSVGVRQFVFSSSAAVYGTPESGDVTEDSPKHPASPYGETKLIGEWLLADQARAVDLAYTALRYFNVIGSGAPELWDSSPHNLLPIVFRALLAGDTPRINGDDYETPDGTNVRDYVGVQDVALAHATAAQRLEAGATLETAYNLGSGSGTSVGEIMRTVADVTGIGFEPEVGPRRPGDPDRIVASGALAARDLDWAMRHDLADMVRSQWEATRRAVQPSETG
jgi:UDP-glucose 4-epimerase